MPRRPRLVVPEHPHHVVLRGNNKRRLFSYPTDYQRFVALLAQVSRRKSCHVHAVVLMTNHAHLVVTPDEPPALARFVANVSQRYSQRRNAQRGGSGRLFEERFFSRPILTDEQLAVTTAYVELNPVRAGMVDEPGEYPWSTYGLHAGEKSDPLWHRVWQPSGWYLALGNSPADRSSRYREWLAGCRDRGDRPVNAAELEIREAIATINAGLHERRPDRTSAT